MASLNRTINKKKTTYQIWKVTKDGYLKQQESHDTVIYKFQGKQKSINKNSFENNWLL